MSLDSNIFLIDDDSAVQDALGIFLSVVGLKIETYLSGKFLWFQPVISSLSGLFTCIYHQTLWTGYLAMRTQPLTKPTLTPPEPCKNNPIDAVAILAGFTAKYQGGNRVKQDRAAMIAVSLLNKGTPAVNAIELAVKRVLQIQ